MEIAEAGGLNGNFTYQSGKRPCTTTLFREGVDEQLIMQRTGHRRVQVRDLGHSRSEKF